MIKIRLKINTNLDFSIKELPKDDPLQRKPFIELAKKELNWEPSILLEDGLDKTIEYFQRELINIDKCK